MREVAKVLKGRKVAPGVVLKIVPTTDAVWLQCLDEGIINMFSFGMSASKEQCRNDFVDVFDTYSVEDVEFKFIELIADQNYAFETGLLKQKWITNDKQDTVLFNMRTVTVYKKQEDGSWKIFRMIGQHEQ